MWVAFANAKATHLFFSKNISIYAIFNDQNFNDTLTNDIVSFEQLGPDFDHPVSKYHLGLCSPFYKCLLILIAVREGPVQGPVVQS